MSLTGEFFHDLRPEPSLVDLRVAEYEAREQARLAALREQAAHTFGPDATGEAFKVTQQIG
jgi:hypothetical protein